jgi:hypothetical protein
MASVAEKITDSNNTLLGLMRELKKLPIASSSSTINDTAPISIYQCYGSWEVATVLMIQSGGQGRMSGSGA